ncbi:SDR family NAD(P)-dependent oxidoreductase [Mycolicibacterium arenosum]|uniref:SDR family oxidoreductase n=1 Tax=Mycolicibacterium arenosum TaxID=2952157 RepID=A0ABT1LXE3_9MYCO|nr:SDR family oxidoreductase [Mycolicibacterium sp. CAU 1645]MCP9271558.1 SDR family oxidoreductase [Mycolicibacterium sp. CAU 1645]
MGGAVARGFAASGAQVFLAGRTGSKVQAVVDQIDAAGGTGHAHEVDVDDRDSVEQHADLVVASAGRIDVSFNAVGMAATQDVALVDMSLEQFMEPIRDASRRHFITATAAARRMAPEGSGVIVMLTASAAKEWRHRMGGFSVGCAAIEVLTRTLAGELKGTGVRVACIRANFTPESVPDLPPGALDPLLVDTLVPRLPRLDEIAAAATYLASDRAGATTGTVLDLTCGAILN